MLYTIERNKQDWELEHDKEMRKQELMEQEEERIRLKYGMVSYTSQKKQTKQQKMKR